MFRALLSYEGKTDEEIFFTDYKEYNIGNKKVSVGNVNAYDGISHKVEPYASRKAVFIPAIS